MEIKHPYDKPWPLQEEGVKQIMFAMKEKKTSLIMVESPTGSGKTFTYLKSAVLLKKRIRIYFASHAQADEIKDLWGKYKKHNPDLGICVHVAGKKRTCNMDAVRYAKTEDERNELCKQFRKGYVDNGVERKCNFVFNSGMDYPDVVDIDWLLDTGARMNVCPRSLMMDALQHAQCICMPHNYLWLDLPNLEGEDDMVVIDEAHNMISKIIETYKSSLTMGQYMSTIEFCITNSRYYKALEKVEGELTELRPIIEKMFFGADSVHMVKEDRKLAIKCLSIAQQLEAIMEEEPPTDEEKVFDKWPPALKAVKTYLSMVSTALGDSYIQETKTDARGIVRSTVEPLFPGPAMKRFITRSKKVLVCSGTLNPKFWVEVLDLDEGKTRQITFEKGNPYSKGILITKAKIGGKSVSVSMTSKQREEKAPLIAKIITKALQDVPEGSGVGMFFPSYQSRELVMESKYFNPIGFEVMESPKSSDVDYDTFLDRYKRNIDRGNKVIFVGAYRGLGSEGYNFPDKYMRMVFLVGVPFPPPDAKMKFRIAALNLKREKLGQEYYNRECAIALGQAYGRPVRHPKDYAVIYILGYEFGMIKSMLPQWVRNSITKAPSSLSEIFTKVSKFFTSMEKMK